MLKEKLKALQNLAPSRSLSKAAYESSLTDEEKDDLKQFKENFVADLIKRKYPRAPQFLQERLVSTMFLRRQQFLYLRWRHSGQQTRSRKAPPSGSQKLSAPSNTVAGLGPIRRETMTSTISVTSWPNLLSTTSFRESTSSTTGDDKPEYPPRPKKTNLNCPYCYQSPPRCDMWTCKEWLYVCVCYLTYLGGMVLLGFRAYFLSTHVDEDLKAYVCLLEECPRPNELYGQKSDWDAHMRQELKSQSGFEADVPADQLFPSCPLCAVAIPVQRRKGHIEKHLKFLALRCLPWTDDVEAGSSTASSVAGNSSRLSSSSSFSLSFDEVPQYPLEESEEELASSGFVDSAARSNSDLRQHQWGFALGPVRMDRWPGMREEFMQQEMIKLQFLNSLQ